MHLSILSNILLCIFFLVSDVGYTQDSPKLDKLTALPDRLFSSLDKKARQAEEKIASQTDKYLSKLQKQETRLKKKLWKKDSALARELFGDIDKRYEQIRNRGGDLNRYSSVYSGHLDSLSTAVQFLEKGSGASSADARRLLEQYKALQERLNASEQIRQQLQARQRQLREQFEKLGMVKQLKNFRKQVYYYQAQVREYKALFEDPSKLEAKLMELVMKMPAFKKFFTNNSMLSGLFALPGSDNFSTASLQGLQTRQMISQLLTDRFGQGPDVGRQLQENVQAAQGQLNTIKSKLSSYSTGSFGNGEADMPESFKPNNQKTRSFLQRLEYGANVQHQRARHFFPVTSDIGLSLGYKLNDQGVIGIGASYKLGLGSGWNNIRITHQGVGLRSYVDWKIKGSLYLTGGYEQHYRSVIQSIAQLRDYSAWQRSGLIGLSKRYTVSRKLKGEMKLLWDFLSYQQVPRGQAVVFRIGYRLK